jgi:recombination protein RecA
MRNLDENKKKALLAAMKEIDKVHGAGTVMLMGDGSKHVVEHIPSGCLSLDKALGIGGYPKGRIIEIYGPESSGKTTVTLHAIASCQAQGGMCAFIDAEHALDPIYAKALGVSIEDMLMSQPDYGEQAIEVAEKLIQSGAVDLVVIDSVAALVPKCELEGDMEQANVGVQARMMSKAMRRLASIASKYNCTVIFINQIREKVGVMYGNPEVTSGGRALKFFSSVRIEVRKTEVIKEGGAGVGNKVKAKIVKNKVAPPLKEAEFEILFGKGISCDAQIINAAIDADIIKKSGSWFTYEGERWHGLAEVRERFEKDADFRDTITKLVMDQDPVEDFDNDPLDFEDEDFDA